MYLVKEKIENELILWDLTDAPEYEFEEIKLSKELLDKSDIWTVLKYENEEYKYYSDDGNDKECETFERKVENEKETMT